MSVDLGKMDLIRLTFERNGYRCREVEKGFIASSVNGTWRVWINYDGDLVWDTNANSYFKEAIEQFIRLIIDD